LNLNNTDSKTNDNSEAINLDRAWVGEWNTYLNSNEAIPEGMGIVDWWGV